MYKSNTIHRVLPTVSDQLNEQDNLTCNSKFSAWVVKKTRALFILSRKLISITLIAHTGISENYFVLIQMLGKSRAHCCLHTYLSPLYAEHCRSTSSLILLAVHLPACNLVWHPAPAWCMSGSVNYVVNSWCSCTVNSVGKDKETILGWPQRSQ